MLTRSFLMLSIGLWMQVNSVLAQQPTEKTRKDGFTRFNDANEFYKDADQVLDFEDAKINDVVNDRYVKKGVSFQSFNEDKSVSVQPYRFAGVSPDKIYSIANRKPTYAGKMKVSFDVGPNKGKGVYRVGFRVAHVKKNGTSVEIYGAENKLLGTMTILMTYQGTGFLGFESNKPIMHIVIVPNLKIDKDFALDDLAFSGWKEKKQ